MSTDATAEIQFVTDPPLTEGFSSACPARWSSIHLRRDYVFFDLLSGGRSGNPSSAVVEHRSLGTNGEAPNFNATWVWVDELEIVANAYFQKTGSEYIDARAIIASMRTLNQTNPQRTRLVVFYF